MFQEHNRIFISKEVDNHRFPFKNQSIVLFSCGGTLCDKPIYSQYEITCINWTDGSNLQTINSHMILDSFVADEKCFEYYEKEWKEVDKSFESAFWMMWENVEMMNKMNDCIRRNIKNSYNGKNI